MISPAGAYDTEPAWSPDGTRLAFTNTRYAATAVQAIFVMNADGSGRTQVTSGPADSEATWSPDGRKIAFVSGTYPHTDVYTVNADGSDRTRLTNGPEQNVQPSWSPDGTKIAFESGTSTYPPQIDIWTIHPDGSGLTRLTSDGMFRPGLDWSPDGLQLVTIHNGPCPQCSPYGSQYGNEEGLYVATVSAEGTNIHNIPSLGGPPESRLAYCCYDQHGPVWSPDKRKLVWVFNEGCFDTCGEEFPQLVIGDVASETVTGAGFVFYWADHPSWQPLNLPPDCTSVTATPDMLWPPNNQFVSVSLTGATDPDHDQVTLTITGVTEDEPAGGSPTAVLGPASYDVSLRAERDGSGDGRVYWIAFKATDGRGGECSGTATVGVPHNHGAVAVDSAPPSYDSVGH